MRYVVGCLVSVVVLFGALLLGMYLIVGEGDQRGVVGLMLLTAVALFLQHRWHSGYVSETERLLLRKISRLEEHVNPSQEEPRS